MLLGATQTCPSPVSSHQTRAGHIGHKNDDWPLNTTTSTCILRSRRARTNASFLNISSSTSVAPNLQKLKCIQLLFPLFPSPEIIHHPKPSFSTIPIHKSHFYKPPQTIKHRNAEPAISPPRNNHAPSSHLWALHATTHQTSAKATASPRQLLSHPPLSSPLTSSGLSPYRPAKCTRSAAEPHETMSLPRTLRTVVPHLRKRDCGGGRMKEC